MTRRMRPFALILCALMAAGCASYDYRDVELLGAATERNIALQSVRDVATPNYKSIDGGEGGSSAKAVAALREGKAS